VSTCLRCRLIGETCLPCRLIGETYAVFGALVGAVALLAGNVFAAAPVNLERAKELSVKPLAPHVMHGVAVPAVAVDSQSGIDLTDADRIPGAFPSLALSAKAAASVQWVHLSAYGWLLIPRGWTVVDAGVGANGSMILVAGGANGAWLEYYDTAASVGSALSAASCTYPQAQKLALEYEMGQCEAAKPPNANAPAIPPTQRTLKTVKGETDVVLQRYTSAPGVNFRSLRIHPAHSASAAIEQFFRHVWGT
jgi:hypothetical protein